MKKFKRPTLKPTLSASNTTPQSTRSAQDLVVFAQDLLARVSRLGITMDARLAVRSWAQRHPIDRAILRIEQSDSPDSWKTILRYIIDHPGTGGGITFPVESSSDPSHNLTDVIDDIEPQDHMDAIRHHVLREMTVNDLRMLHALKHIPTVDTIDDLKRIITRLIDNRPEFKCLESLFEGGGLSLDDLRAFIRQASFWPSPRSDIARFTRRILLDRIRSAVDDGDTSRLAGLLDPIVFKRLQKPEDWRAFIRILPYYPSPASFDTHRSIVLDITPAISVILPSKPPRTPKRTAIPDRNYIRPHIPPKHVEILIRTMPWIHDHTVIDILISAIGEDGRPSLLDPFSCARIGDLFTPNHEFFAMIIGEDGRLNGVWGEDDLLRLPNKKAYAVYTLDSSQGITRFREWRSLRLRIRAYVERGVSPRLVSIEQDRLTDKPIHTFSEDFVRSIRERAVGSITSLLPNVLDPAYTWDARALAQDIEGNGCFRPDATLRDYWACLHRAQTWLDPSSYAFSEKRIAATRLRCGHVIPSSLGCSPPSIYFPEVYLLSADDRRHVMTMIEADLRESIRLEAVGALAQFFPDILAQRKPVRSTILFNLRDTFAYPRKKLESLMADLRVSDPTMIVWDDQDPGKAYSISSTTLPDHLRDTVNRFLDVESVIMGENAAVFADGPIFKYALDVATTPAKDAAVPTEVVQEPIIIPNLLDEIIRFVNDFDDGILH